MQHGCAGLWWFDLFGDWFRAPEILEYVIAQQREQLMWAGFPYHTYILQDIADPAFDPDNYKLFIILAAVAPSKEVREAIEQKVKRGGRPLLWVHLADMDFMGLCSASDGVKRLYLPEGVSMVEDADTGEEMKIMNQYIDFPVKAHETRIFRVK